MIFSFIIQDIPLTNNDILRRLRYTFNFNDQKMISIFSLANSTVTREEISNWLKKEDDPAHINCPDTTLAIFLNGLINDKRGKKDGPQPQPEKRLNNNIILTKLKIALNFKSEDIIEMLKVSGFNISKGELSAFFRKPDHQHYRVCKDQFLRNFLKGIDSKHHVNRPEKFKPKKAEVVSEGSNLPEDRNNSYNSATPKASKIYVNPNKKQVIKAEGDRKTLKLKPKDIWGE